IHLNNKGEKCGGRTYIPGTARDKVAPYISFPVRAFEWGVLSRLHEETEAPAAEGDDRTAEIRCELAKVEAQRKAVVARIVDGTEAVETMEEAARGLKARKAELEAELAEARRSIMDDDWEIPTMWESLQHADNAPATRLRLQSALRRAIVGVWCLFVHR